MPSSSADESELMGASIKPPVLPLNRVYTANYCEENIYLLAKRFLEDREPIEQADRKLPPWQVALWSQKLREDVVVWDYHAILALKPRVTSPPTGRQLQPRDQLEKGSTWIYDLDSRLEMPVLWGEYIDQTFPYSRSEAAATGWSIPRSYQCLFRIVDGEEFLEKFASDRSHMLIPESDPPRYQSPVPLYPCIRGTRAAALGVTNNLMRDFVCMDVENKEIGSVYTLEEAKIFFE